MSDSTKFWRRVMRCKHEWHPDYLVSLSCSTPYCCASEAHCVRCGVYSVTCRCGAQNGMGGWPYRRIRNAEMKRQRAKMAAQREDA